MRISDWSSDVCSSDLASLKALKMFLHPSLNCFAYPVAQLQAGQQRRNVLFQIDRKIDRAASFQGWVAAVQAQREVQFAALIIADVTAQPIIMKIVQGFGDDLHGRVRLAKGFYLRRTKAQYTAGCARGQLALVDAEPECAAANVEAAINQAAAIEPFGRVGGEHVAQLQSLQLGA